jgi:hypothetical protein
MPEWKKGWKVIHKTTRQSITAMYRIYPRVYPKDVVVGRPKDCGPLAVFRTRQSARTFAKYFYCKIVKCLYLPSKAGALWERPTDRLMLTALPVGTILAEKVKCLE